MRILRSCVACDATPVYPGPRGAPRVACGRRINPRAPARPRAGVAEAARRAASSVDGCTAVRTPPPSPSDVLRRSDLDGTTRLSGAVERRSESVTDVTTRPMSDHTERLSPVDTTTEPH